MRYTHPVRGGSFSQSAQKILAVAVATLFTFTLSIPLGGIPAFAADRYWVGSGTYNNNCWECISNWSTTINGAGGASVPGAADIAWFIGNIAGGTNVTIRTNVSLQSLNLAKSWTGSVLQGTGRLVIGAGSATTQAFSVGSGRFIGGNQPVLLSGSYVQSGGYVTGLMNNFSLSGSLTIKGSTSRFVSTGTLIFSGSGNQTFTLGAYANQLVLKNVTVRNTGAAGTKAVIVASGALFMSGALTVNRGKLDLQQNSKAANIVGGVTLTSDASVVFRTNSNVSMSGALTVGALSTLTMTGGTWTLNGNGNQNIDLGGVARFHNLTLNNTNKNRGNKIVAVNPLAVSGRLLVTAGVLDMTTNSKALSVWSGATIGSSNSGAIVTNSNVSLSGSLVVSSTSSGLVVTGGTWTMRGADTQAIDLGGKSKLWNLTLNNTNKNRGNKIVAVNPLAVSGRLLVTAGVLDMTTNSKALSVWSGATIGSSNSGAIVTNSNVSLSGSLVVSSTSSGLVVTGGTWTMRGNSNHIIDLGNKGRFWNLTINNTNVLGSNAVFASNPIAVSGSLTITQGQLNMSTNSKALTIWRDMTIANHGSGSFLTDSAVTLSGSLLVAGTSPTVTVSAGTWTMRGGSGTNIDLGGKRLYNLTINKPSATLQVNGNPLLVSGALVLAGGTLNANGKNVSVTGDGRMYRTSSYTASSGTHRFGGSFASSGTTFTGSTGNMTVVGAFTLSGATRFVAPSGTLSVAGNFTRNPSAAFIHSDGIVVLNGASQTLSGSTTFSTLRDTTASATLTFANGTTTTTEKLLELSGGGTSTRLNLRSSVSASKWFITPNNSRIVGNLDVMDSTNTTNASIACSGGCKDSGNNTGWDFTPASSGTTGGTSGGSGGSGGGGGGGSSRPRSLGDIKPALTPAVTPKVPAPPLTPALKVPTKREVARKRAQEMRKKAAARAAARRAAAKKATAKKKAAGRR